MIEQATAFAATPPEDAGYKSWQASMRKAVMRLDPSERTAGPIPTFGSMVHNTSAVGHGISNAYAPGAKAAMTPDAKPDIAYDADKDDDEYTFADVIDIVNPLQHLPVIGTIYRKLSGDTIKGMSSILGGALFGGPIGAIASTANVVVRDRTGKDIAENALAIAGFSSELPAPPAKNNDIVYEAAEEHSQKNLAAANLYERAANDGRRNFAATQRTSFSWNA